MTLFWILALCLCLLAVGIVLLPTIFNRVDVMRRDRDDQNVGIYSERLAEYKLSLAHGEIDKGEFGLLELELKKNLLSETSENTAKIEAEIKAESQNIRRLPMAMAFLIPLFAVILYSDIGLSWGAIEDVALAEEIKATDPHDKQGMGDSVGKLAEKLKSQPENDEGWFLLAQSYLNMAEYEKAAEAFKFLMDKYPQDHGLASYYAEVVYLADNREMTPRAIAAIDRTLSLNPIDVTMLEIKAMGEFQKGNLVESLGLFKRALASNPDPERAELIQKAISRLEEDLAASGGFKIEEIAQNNKTTEESQPPVADAKKRQIQVLVEVADSVDVGASKSVFIFARAINGPPMPLAVERTVRGALPKLVTLDESMAMMQGMGLANFDKVQVVARISSSGIANVSPDDYQALSETIDLTAELSVIKLKIEKQVKDF
ncbi:MAG: cytochrome c-type biogenesis protein CcmH [Candidatus Azotimanducaceae bacterium]|jgi:cytochrome c-type biogenesis protein CcmH